MKQTDTSDLVKFYVDISGSYENVSLELSVNHRLNEIPMGEYITRLFHTHPSYEFFYVRTEGFCIQIKDKEPILFKKGDICIVPPFCEHYTYFAQPQSARDSFPFVLAFTFYDNLLGSSRNFFAALTSFLGTLASPLVIRAEELNLPLFESIFTSFEGALENGLLKTAFLDFCKILELLLQREQTEKPMLSKTDIIRKIDYLISSCYMYDIKLSELAERFYISERSLNRVVSEYYHDTLHGLLTKKRMLIAAAYLSNTDFSVSKVAELSGYDSLSNFYATFKRHHGILPSDYRRREQKSKS